MGKMPGKLPSQRELLTNMVLALCETLCDDSTHDSADATARKMERHSPPAEETWDSPRCRNLILTLHVIFPGLLLPALDLLDRNLVRRMTLGGGAPRNDGGGHNKEGFSSSPEHNHSYRGPSETGGRVVYTVRSLASTLPRRGPTETATARTHLVHLQAWNCSCAGFAVDAYSATGQQETSEAKSDGERDDGNGSLLNGMKFGGLSAATGFGVHSVESLVCCKHLLACLLAENWGHLPSSRVDDTVCTKEELAGIIAGI